MKSHQYWDHNNTLYRVCNGKVERFSEVLGWTETTVTANYLRSFGSQSWTPPKAKQ